MNAFPSKKSYLSKKRKIQSAMPARDRSSKLDSKLEKDRYRDEKFREEKDGTPMTETKTMD